MLKREYVILVTISTNNKANHPWSMVARQGWLVLVPWILIPLVIIIIVVLISLRSAATAGPLVGSLAIGVPDVSSSSSSVNEERLLHKTDSDCGPDPGSAVPTANQPVGAALNQESISNELVQPRI